MTCGWCALMFQRPCDCRALIPPKATGVQTITSKVQGLLVFTSARDMAGPCPAPARAPWDTDMEADKKAWFRTSVTMLVPHPTGQSQPLCGGAVKLLYSFCSLGLGLEPYLHHLRTSAGKGAFSSQSFENICVLSYEGHSHFIKILSLWSKNMTVHGYMFVWAWIHRSYACGCVHEFLVHGNHQPGTLYCVPEDAPLPPQAHAQDMQRDSQELMLQRCRSCAELSIHSWAGGLLKTQSYPSVSKKHQRPWLRLHCLLWVTSGCHQDSLRGIVSKWCHDIKYFGKGWLFVFASFL